MELNYPQKSNGMYMLSRNDIEQIAYDKLKEYVPQNLERPIPLNTRDFLTEKLGLIIKDRYIMNFDSGILGSIVMTDSVEIISLDEYFRPTLIEEYYGTVFISPSLMGRENLPRRRYTEAHEGSHYILHGPYFDKLSKINACRKDNYFDYIACRKIEICNEKPKTDADWMEWQADSLAAALLMPMDTFSSFVRNQLRYYGIKGGFITTEKSQTNSRIKYEIIEEVAEKFAVSKTAAEIRMKHLDLLRECSYRY